MRRLPPRLCAFWATLHAAAFLAGCTHDEPPLVQLAPGVTYSHDKTRGVELLDVDLTVATVHPTVVAANVIKRPGDNYVGDCHTVRDWAEATHAIAGVNGGYFGDTYDQVGLRKQIVGLAKTGDGIVAPCPYVVSQTAPSLHLIRSAIGFTAEGRPDIEWATSNDGATALTRYNWPVNATRSGPWRVQSAVMCGPRLFLQGHRRITDAEERLMLPGKLARTFVAYDYAAKRPQHLLLGRADAMDFNDVANYLTEYFARVHGSAPREGMCLDGGPSAQLVYREDGTLKDAVPTGVMVPTAVLLLPTAADSGKR